MLCTMLYSFHCISTFFFVRNVNLSNLIPLCQGRCRLKIGRTSTSANSAPPAINQQVNMLNPEHLFFFISKKYPIHLHPSSLILHPSSFQNLPCSFLKFKHFATSLANTLLHLQLHAQIDALSLNPEAPLSPQTLPVQISCCPALLHL